MNKISRGVRNNNPFNIRRNGDKWEGLIDGDKSFCTFKSMMYGVRAGVKLLRNYYRLHDVKTIRQLISRFAPKTENDTESYIKFVCDRAGVDDTCCYVFHEFDICQAICEIESEYHLTYDVYKSAVSTIYM